MAHPWVRVAAIVVSEMNERLSPKKAPPHHDTRHEGQVHIGFYPQCLLPPGTNATMVPTEVPMESEMKQAARKMPASSRWSGSRRSVRFTVASMAPDIFGALGECACQDENPDHQHDILVGCADGILQHALVQAQPFGDAYCINRRCHESNRDGGTL